MNKKIRILALVIVVLLLVSCNVNTSQVDNSEKPISSLTTEVITTTVPETSTKPNETTTKVITTTTITTTTNVTSVPVLTPTPVPSKIPFEKINKDIPIIKGIYLSEYNVASRSQLDRWIKLANETEVNAFVINVKNDLGMLTYDSQNELALSNNAVSPMFNVKVLTDELRSNDIYSIARIVCFKDSIMGEANESWTLKKSDGTNWLGASGGGVYTTWLDVSNEEVSKYIVDIAREVLEKGFDEVQFDYIRFPGNKSDIDYSSFTEPREYYVTKFANYAVEQLNEYIVSVDIFGIVCLDSNDLGGIGQTLASFGNNVDVISPMIYPSHYANSSNRTMGNGIGSIIDGNLYEKPDLDPYGVVYDTLMVAKSKMDQVDNYQAIMRPYIQGFNATYLPEGYWMDYGAEQFKLQIQAIYDAGFESWIFWDASPSYTNDLFNSK